ncbi:MAG: T9SS type A sorting domain-containing protein [Saprospiraceae bacterium]|nr:T9SS type A sorting domain-containing protein [Saprospiraceae bacterium]
MAAIPDGTSGWANVTGGSGSTSAQYSTPNLSLTTYYRAVATSGACTSANSTTAAVLASPTSVGGNIVGGATVCTGTNSTALTLSGHTGDIIKWQSSTNGGTTWIDIAHNAVAYNASNLSTNTQFRTEVKSGVCPSSYSNTAIITVSPLSIGGAVTDGNNQMCVNTSSGNMNVKNHVGSVLTWQKKLNTSTTWENIPNTAGIIVYNEQITMEGKWQYRTLVKSGACQETVSAIKEIDVAKQPQAGVITINPNQTKICAGNPVFAVLNDGSGGIGTPTSSKQYSLNGTTFLTYINGSAIPSINFQNNGGVIHFRNMYGTSGAGCQTSIRNDSIIINPLPQPGISIKEASSNLPNDGKICSGDKITLKAMNSNQKSPAPYSFKWNNNINTDTFSTDLFYNNGQTFNYMVTISDWNNCFNVSNVNSIDVFDNPVSVINYDSKGRIQLYEGQNFDLSGLDSQAGRSANSEIKKYEWFNFPSFLDLGQYNINSPELNDIKFSGIPSGGYEFQPQLLITNNYECSQLTTYEPIIFVRADSNCTIEIQDFKIDYCIDQFPLQLKSKIVVPTNGSILSKNWTASPGLNIEGFIGNNIAENNIKISLSSSGQYTFNLMFNGNLAQCGNTSVPFSLNVFDKPEIESIKSNVDTICQDLDNFLELDVFIKKQNFPHNKKLKISYQINGNSVLTFNTDYNQYPIKLPQIPKDALNEGLNTIKITNVEIAGITCNTLPNNTITIFKVLSCKCENLLIGEGFKPFENTIIKNEYCFGDTLRFKIPGIQFDQGQISSIEKPFVRIYLNGDNSIDSMTVDLNKEINNVIDSIFILNKNNYPVNKELYLTYKVAPNNTNSSCLVEKSGPNPVKFKIFHKPTPIIDSVGSIVCNNSNSIPILFSPDTLFSRLYTRQLDWNSITPGVSISNGYITVDKNNSNLSAIINLTQKNQYSTTFNCNNKVEFSFLINAVLTAPNLSTIARYPGHVYFLEDTTNNICVQWGLTNGTDFSNVTLLHNSTEPNVSSNGYAVFGSENLTQDLEALRKFLYADVWYRSGSGCDIQTAECITRNYYNASLPPKGAPRSTKETYKANIYPNPNSGLFTLVLEGDWADAFEVEWMDYTGRLIRRLSDIHKSQYKTEVPVDVSGVQPGLYLLRIKSQDGWTKLHKIVIH